MWIGGIKRFVATVRDWKHYKRQTGEWPLISIAAYVLHLIAMLAGIALLVWYGGKQGWSNTQLVLVLLPLALFGVFSWDWVQRKIRLGEIRRFKRRRTTQG
jgi:hypothetical protein